jgi:regulator of sirC expression with transglutaminase-like and TPR domain
MSSAIGTGSAVGIVCAVAQTQASLWEFNGSSVSLAASGGGRKFYYEKPRQELVDVGVGPGTLLFEGRRNGNQYAGRAYVFSKYCGALGYDVTGQVGADDRSVTLYGSSPRVDPTCRVVEYRDSVLVFNFIPDTGPAAPQNGTATVLTAEESRQACIQTKDLRLTVRGCSEFLKTAQGDGRTSAYYRRALAYLYTSELDASIGDFNEVLGAKPDFADAYYYRGLAYQRKQDPGRALTDFSETIRRDSNQWRAYWDRAWLYRNLARFATAADDFERAASLVDAASAAKPSEELTKAAENLRKDRKTLKLDRDMEELWVTYLKKVQADEDYRNWSDKPYDLYARNHQLP